MQRTVMIDGRHWAVSASGRRTQYTKDELGLVFTPAGGRPGERRLARFSPRGAKHEEGALNELTDQELVTLFHRSQPAWTAPELGYQR